ncbi:MAG: cytochrome c maturation protein CcmE [Armatimonadetes bacterium]|nr:cytochrome c maturation protein CcmE [Armatimonadota bacterium]
MNTRYLIGGLLLVACAVTTAFTLSRTAIQNVTFAEAKASGQTCQVYGALEKAGIQMEPSMKEVRFRLQEEKTGEILDVHYRHPTKTVNSNLPQASHVRAVGFYNSRIGTFEAEELFTKCPSKYESGGFKQSSVPSAR